MMKNISNTKKGIVTRVSHKIQKTLGMSNNGMSNNGMSNNGMSNTNNQNNKIEHDSCVNESPEKEEKKSEKSEEEEKSEHSDDELTCDDDESKKICFRNVQVLELSGCKGPTGPTGPIGPNTVVSSTFIHLDRQTEQLLAKEDAIIWDANPIKVGNIDNTLNTSEIYVWKPGYYFVYYNLYNQQPCQFSLFKNGNVVQGSTICSGSGNSQNSSALVLLISPSDLISPTSLSPTGLAAKIEVVNHTSTVPTIKLSILNGGSASPQITATVSMFLLYDIFL